MSSLRRRLAVATLLAAALHAGTAGADAPAGADGPALEAFDLRKCVRWEIAPATEAVRSTAYRAARARARPPLQVFEARGDLPEGGELRRFGACTFRPAGKPRLRCAPGLDFPLAGASFVPSDVQKFKGVTTLKCSAGCDQKIPDTVHHLRQGRRAEAAEPDAAERARSAPFRRACAALR